jgi:hypothetical protein
MGLFTLARPPVPGKGDEMSSVAMAMVGHKTEAIYRRYAIVDEVMLQEGGAKLAAYSAVVGLKPISLGLPSNT